MSAVSERDDRAVDVGRRLMAFNWLPAGYAHRDWLGPWADVMTPRRDASLRLVRRVSLVLLERMGLRERYLKDVRDESWILEPHERVNAIAVELGRAMLGGWVRHGIERADVALQTRVLGAEGRREALQYGQRLAALPYPSGRTWPVPLSGSSAPARLGISCLASLLDTAKTGTRDRFLLRFAPGTAVPLELTPRQRDDALSIIHAATPAANV